MWDVTSALQAAYAGKMDAFDPIVRLCHFTNRQAADCRGVSIDTVQRWRRTGRPTTGALKLLAIAAGYVP